MKVPSRFLRRSGVRTLLLCLPLLLDRSARAQDNPRPSSPGIDQKLGVQVTLGAVFGDERGERITLGEASGGKPFILALVYYRCPTLCNQILGGLQEALVELPDASRAACSVITVSFDPREGPDLARSRRAQYTKPLGTSALAGAWRFLTGTPEATERLCLETGFRVLYDPASGLYSHASAILVLTPRGRISRYFMGVRFPPRDLGQAVEAAANEKIGGLADRLILLCFQYDPATGKYTLVVWKLVRWTSALTLVGIGALVVVLLRRRAAADPPAISPPEKA